VEVSPPPPPLIALWRSRLIVREGIVDFFCFFLSSHDRPGFGDTIKRNWQEISLALRFSGHRAKKKVERKVRNM
jgi:hypothetical protein